MADNMSAEQSMNLPAHEGFAEGSLEREDGRGMLSLGQWVIVADEDYHGNPCKHLGCIVEIGSNYANVGYPGEPGRGYSSTRIHFNEVFERLTFLSPTEAHVEIGNLVNHYREEGGRVMGEIQALTLRLGLSTAGALPNKLDGGGTALATMSANQRDIEGYKLALVEAQEKTLPSLYRDLKEANANLARWLLADTLPVQVAAEGNSAHVSEIKDRIFSLTLYAGLAEEVVQVRDGAPAALEDRLHVMQRRHYMDEECLVNYEAGGMSMRDIGEFDSWLAREDNFKRVLPFERTIVAMRVRREVAEREWDGSLMGAHINLQLAQGDKLTFLYIRNGEQLWRLSTDIQFGPMIFPDKSVYDPTCPMMMNRSGSRFEFMSCDEYDQRVAEQNEIAALRAAWFEENPYRTWKLAKMQPGKSERDCHAEKWNWECSNPHRSQSSLRPSEWEPFTQDSVYYDDALNVLGDEIKRYNRVATIIQGLFDRSLVLHPHLPVQTWNAEGFNRAIQLVYDGGAVIHGGDMPDFEAYRAKCNASIDVGSFVVGQNDFWQRREAEKEMNRRMGDFRLNGNERSRHLTRYQPYGNPGPNLVARVDEWRPRARSALFRWEREGRSGWPRQVHPCSITVPETALFNVSAYTPGDFKRFYADSRTRAQYLKWAPFLLAAEDWHAANR